jgi:aspartate racemase
MKTIGLLGGMSWESTAAYYQISTGSAKAFGRLPQRQVFAVQRDFTRSKNAKSAGNERMGEILASGGKDSKRGRTFF